MAYTPTVWQAGDTVTAAKLNKIEQGIAAVDAAGGQWLLVEGTYDSGNTHLTLNKTMGEIIDALPNVVIVIDQWQSGNYLRIDYPTTVTSGGSGYSLDCIQFNGDTAFAASTLNSYPVATMTPAE